MKYNKNIILLTILFVNCMVGMEQDDHAKPIVVPKVSDIVVPKQSDIPVLSLRLFKRTNLVKYVQLLVMIQKSEYLRLVPDPIKIDLTRDDGSIDKKLLRNFMIRNSICEQCMSEVAFKQGTGIVCTYYNWVDTDTQQPNQLVETKFSKYSSFLFFTEKNKITLLPEDRFGALAILCIKQFKEKNALQWPQFLERGQAPIRIALPSDSPDKVETFIDGIKLFTDSWLKITEPKEKTVTLFEDDTRECKVDLIHLSLRNDTLVLRFKEQGELKAFCLDHNIN